MRHTPAMFAWSVGIALFAVLKVTEMEWQTDALAAAADNAVIEGDEATTDVATATSRLTNYTQISDKVPRVTGTQEAVNKAGRRSELAYQIAKRSKELKRDIETGLLKNTAKVAGDDSTARVSGGYPTYTATNVSVGTGGSAAAGNSADTTTEGTERAFTEALLKTNLQECWDQGGDPDCLLPNSFNKQVASTFTGNATRNIGAQDRELVATVDIYESDFGSLEIIPERFGDVSMVPVVQKDMWAFAVLRPFRLVDLARTGDTERKQLIIEWALEARNEAASGLIAGLINA